MAQNLGVKKIKKSGKVSYISGQKYYLHTVQKGQTVYSIAKAYGINVSDIVLENPKCIEDGIRPGQVLKIKHVVVKVEKEVVLDTALFVTHVVKKKETLYGISKRYGVVIDSLLVLNPNAKTGIKIGEVLKVKRKELKKMVLEIPVKASEKDTITSIVNYHYTGTHKDVYKIAFFLPFDAKDANELEVDDLVRSSEEFGPKTEIALQFYEGAVLALESLKKEGLSAKVYMYDVGDSIPLVLSKPEMETMDIIIGPLFSESFVQVSKFAKEHQIAIVSPFIQANKILFDNPFVCKAMSSIAFQVEEMVGYIGEHYQGQNIIMLDRRNLKEAKFCDVFLENYNELPTDSLLPANDSVKILRGEEALTEQVMDSTRVNVVVVPSNNQADVTSFINKLNSLEINAKVVLFGLQSWLYFDNLDIEYLNKFSLHLVTNNYIDYTNELTSGFVKQYSARFKSDPAIYAFSGYDLTKCFGSALQQYGNGFLADLTNHSYQGVAAKYVFVKSTINTSGYENKHTFVLKYSDYELVKDN